MSSVHPFLSILIHWFLRCQCSILSSPVWHVLFTLIHRSNIPGSYAILFFTASDFLLSPPDISTAEHCFCIGPATSFFLGVISNCSLLFSNSILDTLWPEGASSSIVSFCLFILSVGFSRQEYWNDFISSASGPHFVRTPHHDPSILGGPAPHDS